MDKLRRCFLTADIFYYTDESITKSLDEDLEDSDFSLFFLFGDPILFCKYCEN